MAIVNSEIPIEKLRAGAQGRISGLTGDYSEVARLAELGLRQGVHFQVVRSGYPCIIQLGAAQICIRPSRDIQVLVTPE